MAGKTRGAKGQSPRRAGPQKATKAKKGKKSRGAKKPHPSKDKKFPGKRKAHFEKAKAAQQAQGRDGPGPNGEFVERGPDGTFAIINGLPEKGCEGNECRCNDERYSSCKAHPSREKVRTGKFVTYKGRGDKTDRRALWALKALVEAGHVEVEEPVEECA